MGLESGALRRAGVIGARARVALARRPARAAERSARSRITECGEAALGVVAVTLLGVFWPGHWGLLNLQPHPYWLIVLAIGVRYGLPAGYVAGGLSSLGYLTFEWRQRGGSAPLGAHALLQPLLLLAGAIVIGELTETRRRRLLAAEQQSAETAAALDEALTRYRATLAVKAELEQRIVGQPASIMTLYETAKQLETLERGRLYPAILELLTTYIGAEACALYMRDAGGFRLQAARPGAARGRELPLDDPESLCARAVQERRLLTIRDRLRAAGPEALAAEPALLAGPLLDRDGAVSGLVVVERLPFLKFTPTNVRLCGLILDWASTALQNATLFEDALVRAADHDLTGAFTAAHTLKILRDELQRAGRYGLPFSVVLVQAQGLAELPEARRDALLRALGQAFRACLRTVDIVGHHAEPDTFVLALPVTALPGARVIAERVADELDAQALAGLTLRVGLSSYVGDTVQTEVYEPGSGAFLARVPGADPLTDVQPALAPVTREPGLPAIAPAWTRATARGRR